MTAGVVMALRVVAIEESGKNESMRKQFAIFAFLKIELAFKNK